MAYPIVLIGPKHAGKSTLGKLLAAALGLPQVAVDDVCFPFYRQIGYDDVQAKALRAEGFFKLYPYLKPFEVSVVEHLLSTRQDCVIDFGAGHSVYDEPALLARARAALQPCPFVVLLLPAEDPDESIRILHERSKVPPDPRFDFTTHFVKNPSNRELAKQVLYTDGKSPEESCRELWQLVTKP